VAGTRHHQEQSMTLDVATIRKDFPTLSREVHGTRLVYLDSAASSQTPRPVLDTMTEYYERYRSNVHRGVYQLAEEATDLFEGARHKVATFTNAPTEGTVFTKNATEAINLVAYSYVRRRLGPGDVLLTTVMEHHANFVPWLHAAQDLGFEIRHIPLTADGRLDLDAVPALIDDGRVSFLAVAHVSNVLGTINDVRALAGQVRDANPGCRVLVDGSQAAPHLAVDFRDLDVDFYAFTGHKMCGPTGVGVLLGKPEVLESMPPFLTGGEMILDVRLDDVTWNAVPHKFEAGTMMIAEVGGLGAAADYLTDIGMGAIREHEQQLTAITLAALADVDGVDVHGPTDVAVRGGAISFTLDGIHPHDIGAMLDQEGVCVRVGHHCAKPLMRELGVNATARASLYLYNDEDDIAPLIRGIERARDFFAR
jgi:cysteine desulfurase/selenocysteine lyase